VGKIRKKEEERRRVQNKREGKNKIRKWENKTTIKTCRRFVLEIILHFIVVSYSILNTWEC
jgi:hypothetical protein